MLSEARKNAKKKGIKVEFLRKDMAELDFDRKFDCAICFFNSFSHLTEEEKIRNTLLGINRALKEKGIFILEVLNFKMILKNFQHFRPEVMRKEGKTKIASFATNYLDRERNIMEARWLFFIEKNGKTRMEIEDTSFRIHFREGLEKMLENNGFSGISVYGSFRKQEYGEESPRIFVCRKSLEEGKKF